MLFYDAAKCLKVNINIIFKRSMILKYFIILTVQAIQHSRDSYLIKLQEILV